MSRIYEALQRAELERKDIFDLQSDQPADDMVLSGGVGEPTNASIFVDLNTITQHPWNPSMVSLPTLAEYGECVDQFRSLRSQIYLLRIEAMLKTILVSSGMPAEGKTFVAANLAISLARNYERRVLLIDGDLRRPSIHKLFNAPNSPGLSDYLAGNAKVTEIIQRDSTPRTDQNQVISALSNLTLIPAGDCGDNFPEIAGNHRLDELIATLSPHFDWIVMDSPPVLAVTDAVDLARTADAVLLVAREAKTPYDVARRAQAAFSNSRVLGFVLNAVKDAPRRKYYHNYYAGQGAGHVKKGRKD